MDRIIADRLGRAYRLALFRAKRLGRHFAASRSVRNVVEFALNLYRKCYLQRNILEHSHSG
jgi:hypothetical protein